MENTQTAAEDKTVEDKTITPGIWKAASVITLQSFLYGYLLACFNPCLVTGDNNKGSDCYDGTDSSCPPGTVYKDMDLSTLDASLATAMLVIGAWAGSVISSTPSELWGRKRVLIYNSAFFIVGAAISSCSHEKVALFLGRLVSGFGVGIASGVPPVLLSELATDATRGTVTTLHQVMLTLGIFIAGLISYGLAVYVPHGWQYVQGFSGIPAILFLLLQGVVPESPKWLVSMHAKTSHSPITPPDSSRSTSYAPLDAAVCYNHDGETTLAAPSPPSSIDDSLSLSYYKQAAEVLRFVRPAGESIDDELSQLVLAAKQSGQAEEVSWSELLACWRGVVVGGGLLSAQALTGINSVTFYSTTVFSLAGFDQSVIATVCVGLVQVIMVIVVTYLIDRMGRTFFLKLGVSIMLICLLTISIILLVPIPGVIQGIIAVIALLIYVAGFSLGLGAVVWSVMSEIMPMRVRMKAVSLFMQMNWCSNLLISLLTLIAINGLGEVKSSMDDDEEADAQKKGVAYLYFIFAGITAVTLVFVVTYVPETKGMNPEEEYNQKHEIQQPDFVPSSAVVDSTISVKLLNN
eukprot:gene3073-3356_t